MTDEAKSLGREPINNFLSKREYFAGLAMQAIVTNFDPQTWNISRERTISMVAVEIADALLEELAKD